MPDQDPSNGHSDVQPAKQQKGKSLLPRSLFGVDIYLWAIAGIGIALATLFILYAYYFINEHSVKATFAAQNGLNLLIFIAILIQARIYNGQWGAMQETLKIERAKISPRLRVDEVRAVGFEIGQSPAFMVSLVNEGATEAQDVALYVEAERGGVRAYWRGEQIVTVPAKDRRMYPIRWSAVLTQEVIDAYNNVEPWLKVFGYFKYKDIEQPFCYQYYPWIGKRPAEVPYFVPCDFDPRTDINITLGIQSATHGHTADNVALTAGNNPLQEARAQEKTKPESK
jgi:hypothetical protein